MKAIPLWPVGWYVVGDSKSLTTGKIIERKIAGHLIAIFRSESGQIVAVDGFCPHMGARLKMGCVSGEEIRCALHHWKIGANTSRCSKNDSMPFKSRKWHTLERFGLIFVFVEIAQVNNHLPIFPIEDDQTYLWLSGKPALLEADWRTVIVNGHDILHMQTVHQRTLVNPPQFHQTETYLDMVFSSRVERNGGLSSWITQKISKGNINIKSTCYGTAIKIESQMGKFRAKAIFFSLPDENDNDTTTVYPSFAIPKSALFAKLQLRIARALYMAFLKKDFSVIAGMKLKLREPITDVGILKINNFLGDLKSLDIK